MSVVNKFNEARERGYKEMLEIIKESLGHELSEQEAQVMKVIYDFSFEHGVATGTTLLSDAVQNTGKDDHES